MLLTKADVTTYLIMKDCPYCLRNGVCYIEDEYHILIVCKQYVEKCPHFNRYTQIV